MGTALIRLLAASPTDQLVGALAEPGDPLLGRDAGAVAGGEPLHVLITDSLPAALLPSSGGCDVVIDFTAPSATRRHALACAAGGHALVVGTTGLGPLEMAALEEASARIPVLHSRNMSLGVAVLTELVRQAAGWLGDDFEVEILETHHRAKKDSPSGTALQLGEAVAESRAQPLAALAEWSRPRLDPVGRTPGAIGFASLRGGRVVGDHSVFLLGEEELLELTHRATDRALFARGALRAAGWLHGKTPGLYVLRDVLGLPG